MHGDAGIARDALRRPVVAVKRLPVPVQPRAALRRAGGRWARAAAVSCGLHLISRIVVRQNRDAEAVPCSHSGGTKLGGRICPGVGVEATDYRPMLG